MRGTGHAHGAVTVVNAIPAGRGAAFGVGLRTDAVVEIVEEGFEVELASCPDDDPRLATLCASRVMEEFGVEGGARISTASSIPVSRGLKSSSAAANAVIRATLDALGETMGDERALLLGTRCAIDAGVSITGALDDAAASWFGGLVMTSNTEGRILARGSMPEGLEVLIHVPNAMLRKRDVPVELMRTMSFVSDMAMDMAMHGDVYHAMMLNGLYCSSALGMDTTLMHRALEEGAFAAGLTGTGPATAIIVAEGESDHMRGIDPEATWILTEPWEGDA